MNEQIVTALIGLVGVLAGSVGRDVVVRLFMHEDKRADDATAIRKELYEEVKSLRAEIARLDDELDKSRKDYWSVYAENVLLKREQSQLKYEHDQLKAMYDEVAKELAVLRGRQTA